MANRGAIFDLDGTLADTADDLLAAANVALAPHGLPLLTAPQDRAFAGRGGRAMIRRSLDLAGHDPDADDMMALTDRMYPELLEAYSAALAVHTRLFDGVHDCIDQLEADGWCLGVCTNKPERMALAVLDALGVLDRFAAVLGADTLPVRKPDPVHLTETATRIGADPMRCIMIGDTITDLKTAQAAGVPCILTSFGFAAEPLEQLNPDAIVDHFDEIPATMERLCPPATDA